MKKLLCVLLALMLVFLAGCGISQEELQEKLNDPQIQEKTEAVLSLMLAFFPPHSCWASSTATTDKIDLKPQFSSSVEIILPYCPSPASTCLLP